MSARRCALSIVTLLTMNVVAFLVSSSPSGQQVVATGTVDTGGGRIVLREEHLRFGERFEDEPVTLSLRIRNVGTGPLLIRSIRPGCGCATVRVPDEAIPPGGESPEIPIEIRLRGFVGPYAKTGFVTSNDPTAPQVPFYMEGRVARRLDIEPSALRLQPESPGGPATGSLRVTRLDGGDLRDLAAESPLRDLHIEVRRMAASNSVSDIILQAACVTEPLRTGLLVRIPGGIERIIPVVLSPRRDVECEPPSLSTGLTARGRIHSLKLVSSIGDGWSVKRVGTSRGDLVAMLKEREIHVTWGADAPDGVVSGEVEVTLAGARPETLRVPVTSFLSEPVGHGQR